MMRSVLLALLVALAIVSFAAARVTKRHSGKELVEHVNKQGKWTAKVYPQFEGKTREELRRYLPIRSSKVRLSIQTAVL
ncbi:hypothetical protein M3Y99_00133700 [Aphelenchoides fujianensis]|nr:hypothetical protein M3Y99_00133700 [Aphelenchoides fujianensis]